MVTDFKETLAARMVVCASGVKFLTTWIKEDLTFGEVVEFSTSLLSRDDCEEQIYSLASTEAEAEKHICLLLKCGRTTLVSEY